MNGTSLREYLGAIIGDVNLAVAVDYVQEAFETRTITRLPGCPRFVVGMVNVRGMAVPVLDLFDASSHSASVKPVVILKSREGLVGLLINRLLDLVRLGEPAPVKDVPRRLATYSEAVKMQCESRSGVFYVLDVETMISATLPVE